MDQELNALLEQMMRDGMPDDEAEENAEIEQAYKAKNARGRRMQENWRSPDQITLDEILNVLEGGGELSPDQDMMFQQMEHEGLEPDDPMNERIEHLDESAVPSEYRISGRAPTGAEQYMMDRRQRRRDYGAENNIDDLGPAYDTSVVGDDNVPDGMGQFIEAIASQLANQDPAYQAYKQRVMRPSNVQGKDGRLPITAPPGVRSGISQWGDPREGIEGHPTVGRPHMDAWGDDMADDPRDYTPSPAQMLRQLRGY